jgi:signal transduction histidine kinase
MELKTVPKDASQFWPYFSRRVLLLVILAQIIISLSVGSILVYFGYFDINSIMLWLIVGGLLIINLGINLIIFTYAIRPTRDLLAAIISVSGEKSELTPPNPNTEKNEQTGFHDALQIIYELSSNGNYSTKKLDSATNEQKSLISGALDTTTCGFIALNNKRQIIYTNKSAPTQIDTDGKQILSLIFNGKDTLDSWLDDCDENSVHAENIWKRIPDRLPNQEDRHFFDIIASYQKGATPETVLVLINKTSSYIVDEENLDFISFAAHELRGPITVIRGYLDVLNDELKNVLEGDQKELFRRLIVSSNRLSGYIDNILNTSRYDRRHLKVHLAEDSVAAIYDIISDDMKLRADAQNRLLVVSFPLDLPTIAADRASISEVFGNLIDNAIKYSNEGGTIKITAVANGDFVDVSVQDNGIGMPENVVSNLFQKFYRSHRSRETVSGTGIGLYISKGIVESHGGTISVRSEDGKGSTFIVSLPIYSTVADKLLASDNSNEGIISEGNGWIKNHSMFRG